SRNDHAGRPGAVRGAGARAWRAAVQDRRDVGDGQFRVDRGRPRHRERCGCIGAGQGFGRAHESSEQCDLDRPERAGGGRQSDGRGGFVTLGGVVRFSAGVGRLVTAKISGIGRQFGCLLGVAMLAMPGEALAGAWTLDPGTWQIMSIGQFSTANRIFDADRNVQSAPRYNKYELTTTIEYGVTSWLTAVLAPQLQQIEVGSPINAQRAGLGYTDVGGRVRLYDGGSSVFSLQSTVRIQGATDYIN